jgi:hypothetical protein
MLNVRATICHAWMYVGMVPNSLEVANLQPRSCPPLCTFLMDPLNSTDRKDICPEFELVIAIFHTMISC